MSLSRQAICRFLHETGSYLLSVAVQVRTPLSALRLPQLAADRNCEDENSHGHRQPAVHQETVLWVDELQVVGGQHEGATATPGLRSIDNLSSTVSVCTERARSSLPLKKKNKGTL